MPRSLIGLPTAFTAGALSVRYFGGLCSPSTERRSALLLAATFGLMAVREMIHRSRIRGMQRLIAAVDLTSEM